MSIPKFMCLNGDEKAMYLYYDQKFTITIILMIHLEKKCRYKLLDIIIVKKIN